MEVVRFQTVGGVPLAAGEAPDIHHLSHASPPAIALNVHHVMNLVGNFALNGCERKTNIGLERQAGETIQRIPGRAGVHRAERAQLPSIERLQQVIGGSITDFANNETVWPMPQRSFHEIADRDAGMSFEPSAIEAIQRDFRRVFD
jgi:hypothetical protein